MLRGTLAGALDQQLDGAHRRRALPRHLGRQQEGGATGLAAVHHLFDQADAQGGFRIHSLAAENPCAWPSLRRPASSGAGVPRLRRAARPTALPAEPVAPGARRCGCRMTQGTFQSATHGVAVDRGNRHAAEIAQGLEGFAETASRVRGRGPCRRRRTA